MVKKADATDLKELAGMVLITVLHDGTVSLASSNLTKEGVTRAIQYALFAAGATKIGKRSELD